MGPLRLSGGREDEADDEQKNELACHAPDTRAGRLRFPPYSSNGLATSSLATFVALAVASRVRRNSPRAL